MKKILFISLWQLVAAMVFTSALPAQNAEKIYSWAQVHKPNDFYEGQIKAWRKVIDKDPQNADAWLNYYMANRYAKLTTETGQANMHKRWERINGAVEEMGKTIPNTFEYNYVKWWNGGNDHSLFSYLQKAYEITPERPDTYEDLATYYETTGNTTLRDQFMRKLVEAGEYSPGLMNYNYNVLMGLEKDAIVITAGDNDTYYIWMLQAAKGIRKDVTVLNTSLMTMREYQDIMYKELGIRIDKYDTAMLWEDYMKYFHANLVKAIAANTEKRPVYVGVTVHHHYTDPVKDNLYLTGLALQWSEKRMDNIALLRRNIEQNYALDYLRTNFVNDGWEGIVNRVNANYLVPLLNLYEHYHAAGEDSKAGHIKELATTVAGKSEQAEEVKKYFQTH